MTYASIMVGLDIDSESPARVELALDLADRFEARLIGAAAREPDYPRGYGETGVPAGFGIEEIRQAALDQLTRAQRRFQDVAGLDARREWRSDLQAPATFLAAQSRAADLVILGRPATGSRFDATLAANPGDALMAFGRPILVVPPDLGHLSARRIVIAWKNTLQTRRAVSDAMPFLKRAEAVRIVGIDGGGDLDDLRDVADFLALHGIEASSRHETSDERTVAGAIQATVAAFDSDLIVSGAYGYSRLREWFFGGVTRELLDRSPVCCLMAH